MSQRANENPEGFPTYGEKTDEGNGKGGHTTCPPLMETRIGVTKTYLELHLNITPLRIRSTLNKVPFGAGTCSPVDMRATP